VWPRHRLVMPTSRKPANIPTQRCGAVGSLAIHGEEEVTSGVASDCRRVELGFVLVGRRRSLGFVLVGRWHLVDRFDGVAIDGHAGLLNPGVFHLFGP
jgi:hypothetical protein